MSMRMHLCVLAIVSVNGSVIVVSSVAVGVAIDDAIGMILVLPTTWWFW